MDKREKSVFLPIRVLGAIVAHKVIFCPEWANMLWHSAGIVWCDLGVDHRLIIGNLFRDTDAIGCAELLGRFGKAT